MNIKISKMNAVRNRKLCNGIKVKHKLMLIMMKIN